MTALVALTMATLVVRCNADEPDDDARHSVDFRDLRHGVGAYLLQPDQLQDARRAGFTIAHGSWIGDQQARELVDSLDMSVLDARLKNRMYLWLYQCQGGRDSCTQPSEERLDEFEDWVARMVARDTREQAPIAGYYVLDDWWAEMRAGLERIHRAVRANSNVPVVCGLGLNVPTRNNSDREVDERFRSQFLLAASNYSPDWCDAVAIYSYRRGSGPNSVKENLPPAEWAMERTLPRALEVLEDAGFDFSEHLLIGVPQAFEFFPRTADKQGKPIDPPQFRWGPYPRDLQTQVEAFCEAGASAIIAYSWDPWALPAETTKGLVNSPGYRSAINAGVSECGWPSGDLD